MGTSIYAKAGDKNEQYEYKNKKYQTVIGCGSW